ncbi:unnamed protein product [Amaranthus hypochondriacus]
MSGNSYIVQNAIQVTADNENTLNISGRSLHKQKFYLRKGSKIASFNTTFVLNIQAVLDGVDGDGGGGEGLAFILAKDHELPINSSGQWLGIVNSKTNGSTDGNIVAVEFDTKKSFPEDLDDNHVGLNVNSVYSVEQVSISNKIDIRIDNGTEFSVMIMYNGTDKVMNVSVKKGNGTDFVQILTVKIDLSVYLPREVYVGFSGSTGSGWEKNCVKSWMFDGEDVGKESRGLMLWVWIVIGCSILVVLGVLVGLLWFVKRRKTKQVKDEEDLYMQSIETGLGPKRFRLRDVKSASGDFSPSNELGRGGFGVVYKGTLGGNEVAIKRIKNSRQGKQNLIAEVTTIGNLRHKNLVELVGWCYEKNELLLVYEYMPNGSLDKFICSDDENVILSWETRHRIICGVAQSLDYLHHECSKRVLHRDIKTSNIMLDSEFNARLGDFGLARMFTKGDQTHHSTKELMGTPGYMAPEILLMGHSTAETDVFAFGVLVLVVASGRMPGAQHEDNGNGLTSNNLVDWIWELYRSKKVVSAVDPKLKGNFNEQQTECMFVLGLACCDPNPHMRPSMRTALQVLMGEALPPLVPLEKPVFMWPATPRVSSLNLEGESLGVENNRLTSIELSPR